MTVEAISAVVTGIVTYIFGIINKKLNITDTNYIPLQNLIIGVATGCACYALGIMDNLTNSIVICTVSAFGAGGAYDLTKIRGEKNDEVK